MVGRTAVRTSCALAALINFLGVISPALATGTIQTFETPYPNFTNINAISADGSVMAGMVNNTDSFRWSAGGFQILTPPGGGTSDALAVSGDGTTVVGLVGPAPNQAYRWTSPGGMQKLGFLNNLNVIKSVAWAASYDGSVVVGMSNDEAFRWTASTGMVGLRANAQCCSIAQAISADGQVIAGQIITDAGREAFRWTSATSMVALGDLPGGAVGAEVAGMSSDGSVIVGIGTTATGNEAFRWTAGAGMQPLGHLNGQPSVVHVAGVSGDGKRIVGDELTAQGYQAFLWDGEHGIRSLKAALQQDFGMNLTGWDFHTVNAMSADGRLIIAYGNSPGEFNVNIIAAIPEPTAFCCMAFIVTIISTRRWRRRR